MAINKTIPPGTEVPVTAILDGVGGIAPYTYDISWFVQPDPDITFVVNNENEVRISVGADVPLAVYNGTIRGIVTDTAGRVRVSDLPVTITVGSLLSTCGELTLWSISGTMDITTTEDYDNFSGPLIGFNTACSDDCTVVAYGTPFDASMDSTPSNVVGGAIHVMEFDGVDWAQRDSFSHNDNSDFAFQGDNLGGGFILYGAYTRAVSMNSDGSVIVAGAPAHYDNEGGNVSNGSAYVFVWNGTSYEQTAKLVAKDYDIGTAGWGEFFGICTAIRGDGGPGSYVFVGSMDEAEGPGSTNYGHGFVHMYENIAGTWTHVDRFGNGQPPNQTRFAQNMRISRDGNTLVVTSNNTSSTQGLTLAVFRWNDGLSQMELYSTIDPGLAADSFGDISVTDDGARIAMTYAQAETAYISDDNGDGSFTQTTLVPSVAWAVPHAIEMCGTGEVVYVTDMYASRVVVFKYDGVDWTETEIVSIVDNVSWDYFFGWSLCSSQDGTTLIATVPEFTWEAEPFNVGPAYIINGT